MAQSSLEIFGENLREYQIYGKRFPMWLDLGGDRIEVSKPWSEYIVDCCLIKMTLGYERKSLFLRIQYLIELF